MNTFKIPDMIINPIKQKDRFQFLVERYKNHDGPVRIEKIAKPRSNNQNRYLHSILSIFAIELGYTLDEIKTICKRDCWFMIYKKNNQTFLRKSSDLDTKEMTDWIDWIRNKASIEEIYLPSPDDYHRNWELIYQEIEANKQYL